jgi:transcriptional regulator
VNSCAFHYREYTCTRPDLIDALIRHYPLALINSETQGQLHASHIPLFRAGDRSLFGHVDRRNPQFCGSARFPARLVFMGPQSYIPPEAYRSRLLPTWNYVAVHIEADIEVVDDASAVRQILSETTGLLQPPHAAFQYDADDPRIDANVPHILGLRIHPRYEEGRFKLSQDKCQEDRLAALEHLLQRDEEGERELMEALMRFAQAEATGHV